jgi:hypothetical protein
VTWAPGDPAHDANVDLVLGRWGEGAAAEDRVAIALLFRPGERAFMLVDAASRPVAASGLVSRGLARAEVAGTPLAEASFALVDAIMLQDARVAGALGAGEAERA